MKKVIIFLTVFFFSSIDNYAQLEDLTEPINNYGGITDFSKSALIDSSELDSSITYLMNLYHIPGLAALITTINNGIIWKRNYGSANIALNQPVEDSTIFKIASISKTFVATAIMQFWEADSFNLDDNINDYLEEFQVHIPNYENDTITFRMLLTHTSSIKDNSFLYNALIVHGDSPIPLDSFLINYFTPGGIYYDSTANFITQPPGMIFEYSNMGVCVLAYLVEKFSGISFDQYCHENIFEPLEMYKTSWFLTGMDTTTIARPYFWNGFQNIPYFHSGSPHYPAGQLRTNKIELEHYLAAYMNWGRYKGTTLLDSSTVDLMLTDQLGYLANSGYQGLIWIKSADFNGRWPWGHTGGILGGATGMFFKQEEGWGIICFMNSSSGSAVLLNILNLLADHAQDVIGGIENKSNPVTHFYLEQNYPNPFNPTTVISWQVAVGTHQTLIVYDLLGREIATLVDEYKSAGRYQAEFDAAALPAGIYFFQLKAGHYVDTKKMILIK